MASHYARILFLERLTRGYFVKGINQHSVCSRQKALKKTVIVGACGKISAFQPKGFRFYPGSAEIRIFV